MGTGLMQWTAARWMEWDAMDCCGFVNLWCFYAGCELTIPDPSALILSVKFCDQETGTNLHTQERNERSLNAPAVSPFLFFVMFSLVPSVMFSFLSCSLWRQISQRSSCIAISLFCHVLFGAICHVLLFVMFSLAPNLSYTRAGTQAHVHLFL
jgi:hypothetical protein